MSTIINGSSPSVTFSDSTTQTTAFTTTPVINTINSQASTPLTLGINGTEQMRISSAGIITTPNNSAFIAYMSASSTATTIPFNTVFLNRGGTYNTSTYTFVAPVTGLYNFNLIISWDGTGSAPSANYISLYVNGARTRDMFEANSWSTNTEIHSSALLYLTASDSVTVYNSGSANIQGGNNLYYSQWSGYSVG